MDQGAIWKPQFGAVGGQLCTKCKWALLYAYAIVAAMEKNPILDEEKGRSVYEESTLAVNKLIRLLMAHLTRVDRLYTHVTWLMLSQSHYSLSLILDFKGKCICKRHSESQTFHFGKAELSVHGIAFILMKPDVPQAALDAVKGDVGNVKK